MSYDIYIGEPTIATSEDDESPRLVELVIAKVAHPDAPVFVGDEMTNNENHRHPGYTQWHDFCAMAGLTQLFFGVDGLLSEHPGIKRLTRGDYTKISAALRCRRKRHPGAKPGFSESDEFDGILARLIWLEFWVRWALKTCTYPSIYNH